MTISLNVLHHLGINLYSNVPAVISEVVANSWDADSDRVNIKIDRDAETITITDNGHGMTQTEVNERYLNVGFKRRLQQRGTNESGLTEKYGRAPMGRKGIGKLSLFSIADVVEVYTMRNGEQSAFRMDANQIEEEMKKAASGQGVYDPEPIDLTNFPADLSQGTRIVLKQLKKRLHKAAPALRRRLARRFSILGAEYHFEVELDGAPITVADRDYFHKIQYLWFFGDDGKAALARCNNIEKSEERSGAIPAGKNTFSGWIGTALVSTDLQDQEAEESLNRIVIMVRGKLAQEDVLEVFNEGGVYAKYIIGEIHANFLDLDSDKDISTSSRQRIIEDDPRYQELKETLHKELLNIQNKWKEWREDKGTAMALEIEAISKWYKQLPADQRKYAKKIFGAIAKLPIDNDADRRRLLKQGILAFESFAAKKNLAKLDTITSENVEDFALIIGGLDEIEATWYYEIVKDRIAVINTLRKHVDSDALEKVLQRYLFDHLWLLDPNWERATEVLPSMEQSIKKAFKGVDAGLTPDELESRLDIRFKTVAGKNVIIELKRAGRKVDTPEILKQASRYRHAVQKVLNEMDVKEPVEVVVALGKNPADWTDAVTEEEWRQTLEKQSVRVVLYQKLIKTAEQSYKEFLDRNRERGRIREIIEQIGPDESEKDDD